MKTKVFSLMCLISCFVILAGVSAQANKKNDTDIYYSVPKSEAVEDENAGHEFFPAPGQNDDQISDFNISIDSPDGKYCAQTTGEEELGGRTYPSMMQVIDAQTGQTLWEEHAYLDTAFLWSPDSKYLAVGYSGRTWRECKIIDTASWKELPNTDIFTIKGLADGLPEIYENGIAKVNPTEWLKDTILLEIYWDTPDGQAVTGSVQYHVQTQEYDELKWELVSVG